MTERTSKYDDYMSILQNEILKSTQNLDNWLQYLDCASRNFKHDFNTQLLINKQKPNATAIADYNTWNEKLGRIIKKGTAMYVPANINGRQTVLNYFDVSDTLTTKKSKTLPLWKYTNEHKQAVTQYLHSHNKKAHPQFAANPLVQTQDDNSRTLHELLESLCSSTARDYTTANLDTIHNAIKESNLFSEYPDRFPREQAFLTTVVYSMALLVNNRLGIDLDPNIKARYFSEINANLHLFNTQDSINALGNAVSNLSKECLIGIEKAVKAHNAEYGLIQSQQDQTTIKTEDDLDGHNLYSSGNKVNEILQTGDRGRDRQVILSDEHRRHGIQPESGAMVHYGSLGQGRQNIAMPVPQYSDGREFAATAEVGADEDGLFNREQKTYDTADGHDGVTQTLLGDRAASQAAVRHNDGSYTARPKQQSYKRGQERRPYGVGGQDEQLSLESQRDYNARPDLHVDINVNENHAKPGIDNIEAIDTIEKAPTDIGAFSMPNAEPDTGQCELHNQKIMPVFVVDWKESKNDFNLELYTDGDIVAYDKDGVSYGVSRTDGITFITSTTSITPIGDILGDKNIPSYIRADMYSFRNSHVTAEEVRNMYLQRIEAQKLFIENEENSTVIEARDTVKVETQSTNIATDTKETKLADDPPGSNQGFILNYTYAPSPDRFVVTNLYNSDTRNAPPIVALSYPDGNVTVQEQHCPNGIMPPSILDSIKTYTAENIARYKEIAEGQLNRVPETGTSTDATHGDKQSDVVAGHINAHVNTKGAEADDTNKYPETIQQLSPQAEKLTENKPQNFRLDSIDYDSISAGGAKSKFKRNIEAIRTLKAIEAQCPPGQSVEQITRADGRAATPDEQKTLAHYVGWGGIADAFSPHKAEWRNEYNELKELLDADEYEAARASTLTAYYTDPAIMKAMWDKIEDLGGYNQYGNNIKGVNILEPSLGIGNFFGVMPEHLSNNANIYGVELDSISGRISRLLYPNTEIQIKGFEKTIFKDDFFDIAIGNVPFSDSITPRDWKYDKEKFLIHDYFFNKALDKVRPGGVVAFITSAGTLDKVNDKARIAMAEKAKFLGAIRLPNNAFKQNAGTEVVSDIIFLQKREEPIDLSKIDLSNHGTPKGDVAPLEVSWVHTNVVREQGHDRTLGRWINEHRINSYFIDNPHMVLGEYKPESGRFGYRDNLVPIEGAELGVQLSKAMTHIQGNIPIREIEIPDLDETEAERSGTYIEYNHEHNGFYDQDGRHIDAKDSSFVYVGEDVYFRTAFKLKLVEESTATMERIKGMLLIRNCLRDLLDAQVNDRPDIEIKQRQNELNSLYDNFTAKHGLITSTPNASAFDDDDSYYLLSSLEKFNSDMEFEGKADVFTKRTIKPDIEITSVETSAEALGVSIGYRGHVDLDYMSELSGKDRETLLDELRGVVFLNAGSADSQEKAYVTADEYLSGNVREKLIKAEAAHKTLQAYGDNSLAVNVEALKAIQPKDLEAHEIYVRLGTTWVDKKYIQQFMYEVLDTPNYKRATFNEDDKPNRWNNAKSDEKDRIVIQYSPVTNEWRITNKNSIGSNNIKANVEHGTEHLNAYHILEQTLNLKEVVIKDKIVSKNGKEIEIVNEAETTIARQKQEDIKKAFEEWVFKDYNRRTDLVALYNTKFNSIRPRQYDGSHIIFGGMNAEIRLETHQINAVARGIYGGNTLLAHEVGAGKSFEMIATAMEAKRIGQCSKALFAVPKHLTGQMAAEFLRLYPNANILVATDKTFEPKNRKRFLAKAATGNYDAIIMGHTQFEMIPLSHENQEKFLKEQFDALLDAIEEAKLSESSRFTVKQLENAKNKVRERLDKLYKEDRKENIITFEQLGVDKLFVDEADMFKNLHLYTKMRNVAGIAQTEAQKSADMYMKCRYIGEQTNEKGVVFATGTPISNSLTELYTMQKYLQHSMLKEHGLEHFDQWASIFTEPTSEMELAPDGTGYRMRTRCSKFHNLPELMNLFTEVADIKTAASLNLPRPTAHYSVHENEPTQIQKDSIQALAKRADKVRKNAVDKKIDNMLSITNDGRYLGLDQRVLNPLLPDDPDSKVNACISEVQRVWEETKNDKLTQIIFCDLSTPKKNIWAMDKEQKAEMKGMTKTQKEEYENNHTSAIAQKCADGDFPSGFNVYDDIKAKLILQGVPEHEIAFAHDATNDKQTQQLHAKVRSGAVRILIGSTAKCGAGTNIQNKLKELHHLDIPWRPRDLEQREGRLLRRGNSNTTVGIHKYITKDTFDAYLYQTLEKKQQFISQIMTDKSPVRSMDDVDQVVLTYAEIKALCVGNQRIKEKMDLERELQRLNLLQAAYRKTVYSLETNINSTYPSLIAEAKKNIANYITDSNTLSAPKEPMIVNGVKYSERADAGQAIKEACRNATGSETATSGDITKIGSYRGFDLHLSYDAFDKQHVLVVKGTMPYPIKLESDFAVSGIVSRIDNMLDKIPSYITSEKAALENHNQQLEQAKIEALKPFAYEDEIKEKTARLAQLDVELSLDAVKAGDATLASTKTNADARHVVERAANKAVDNDTSETIPPTTFDVSSEIEVKNEKFESPQRKFGQRDKSDAPSIPQIGTPAAKTKAYPIPHPQAETKRKRNDMAL